MDLKAGIARRDITPPEDTCGRLGPDDKDKIAAGSLYANALVLQQGDQEPVVIVGCDLVGICGSTNARIRKRIAAEAGIPEDRIVIYSIHSHASPWTWEMQGEEAEKKGLPVLNKPWFESVIDNITDAVKEASGDMWEAEFFTGSTKIEGIASNRLIPTGDGKCIMRGSISSEKIREYPVGLIDPELSVMCLKDSQGNIRAVLMNYPCHPSSLGGGDVKWFSADFPGYAVKYVEDKLGPQTVAFFAMGTSGDINPGKFTTKPNSLETAEKMGEIMGRATVEIVNSFEKPFASQPMQMLTRLVPLPTNEAIPSMDEARKRFDAACEEFKKSRAEHGGTAKADVVGKWRYAIKKLDMRMLSPDDIYNAEIKVLRLGDTCMVFLPGEIFVEIGLEIKRRSPFRKTFIFTVCDFDLCYVPSQNAFEKVPTGYGVIESSLRLVSQEGAALFEKNIHEMVAEVAEED